MEPGAQNPLGHPSPSFHVFWKSLPSLIRTLGGTPPSSGLVPWRLLWRYFSNNPVLQRWLYFNISPSRWNSLIPPLPHASLIAKTAGICHPLLSSPSRTQPLNKATFWPSTSYGHRQNFPRRGLEGKIKSMERGDKETSFHWRLCQWEVFKPHFLAAPLRCISC